MSKAVIALSLMDDFKCAGSKCKQSCCAAPWELGVDGKTLARWQSVKDAKTREWLLAAISDKKGLTTSDSLLRRNSAQSCILLREDGLCGVQMVLGHEYLPATCRSYPRLNYHGQFYSLLSGGLSCPEVIRLVMNEVHNGELFRRRSKPRAATPLIQRLNQEIDQLTELTLGARQFELGVRVAYLAHCVGEMTATLQKGHSAEALLTRFAQNAEKEMAALRSLERQGFSGQDRVRAGRFWNLLHVMGQRAQVESSADNEAARLRAALNREDRNTDSFYTEVYAAISAAREVARPMLRAHANGLERCLRVMLANRAFPWDPIDGHYTAALLHALLPLGWLHLAMWQMYDQKANIADPALLIWLLAHTERVYAHNLLVPGILSANKALLNTELYHTFFLDLF